MQTLISRHQNSAVNTQWINVHILFYGKSIFFYIFIPFWVFNKIKQCILEIHCTSIAQLRHQLQITSILKKVFQSEYTLLHVWNIIMYMYTTILTFLVKPWFESSLYIFTQYHWICFAIHPISCWKHYIDTSTEIINFDL